MNCKVLRYTWTDAIWAVHIEVNNEGAEKGTLQLEYVGTDYKEQYPIGARSNMRYNVCRHSAGNTHLLMTVPESCHLLLFENQDRAFYTDAPAALEVVEESTT